MRKRSCPAVSYRAREPHSSLSLHEVGGAEGSGFWQIRTHMLSFTFLPLTSILCTYVPHTSHERTEQDEQEAEK